jgi:hypothetical protein
MSEPHAIVVRVKDGKVSEVLFCDCSAAVLVEVRTYTDSIRAAALARPTWQVEGGDSQPSQFKRDEHGVYEASYYEPEVDNL